MPERDFHPLELSTLLGRTPLVFEPIAYDDLQDVLEKVYTRDLFGENYPLY
ncbi:hypothetical protein [Bathymodiolus platifrons methanotrophic gill symbiont]|uniref:hypothetical protein n=1 Tax=Bathymodiolus platifrons methanotrophic gill symbiont TaxID=113268 RepID=UPI001C8DF94B|nr:hypothetical protein [Bathymodiolus platifrons methanotrophic gill symbiont]